MNTQPLISLEHLYRHYPSGDGFTTVLEDINLTISKGEMVAIVGASGSGKSTLMNILGCLDRPSEGKYRISGRETSDLDSDELAQLRREHFGFIFQRYHLLNELSAVGNVEIPAIYAGQNRENRQEIASGILGRLGLSDKLNYRPGQLSGGQQQRVSIARALINDADIILADEPTGALDKHSGEEVLKILEELHGDGKTIIIVTHDHNVAARAERIIEISDGVIISDKDNTAVGVSSVQDRANGSGVQMIKQRGMAGWRSFADRFNEALLMALRSLSTHGLRTFLTMLGIIIGIASVVCVVALGKGSSEHILKQISDLGTNTLEIYPGRGAGDLDSGRVTTLTTADAHELAKLPYIVAATPAVLTMSTARFGHMEANATLMGVSDQYFLTLGSKLLEGRFFDEQSVLDNALDAVIDESTRKTLFAGWQGSVIGQVVILKNVPVRIIGIIESDRRGFDASEQRLSFYLPYTTIQTRITGTYSLRSITVRVQDDTPMEMAETGVTAFLSQRHGEKDFGIYNADQIRKTITKTTQALSLLVASIAFISLVVGGIGVMNIMLVSVTERINEIGVRMAVGARRSDILQQFLIEAVLVCLIGGMVGIAVALGFGWLFRQFNTPFELAYSPASIIAALVCSSVIGISFGFLPARKASNLDPVACLVRD
ncbi:MacB family efflux pump subunit (plasmid) [Phyllobacterium sp. 628]|uniref:MacB family efflux pump subunit n=1 Tax=Phyllobacterium sp. 628 TaxID=2718938 RepID=UPI0016628264|nr:MacB family efflux pump subunit [Phyllobacterium sp. 628]QND54451.1 MacB family efflux pump subunit [Phyllobacterium sp. 628]